MVDLIKLIKEILPMYVIASIVFIVFTGWLIKSLKNKSEDSLFLKNKYFIGITAFLILINISYFSYHKYIKHDIEYKFQEKKYGVYISNLENDDGSHGKLLKAAIATSSVELEVFLSKTKKSLEHEKNINNFMEERNISFLIRGTVVTGLNKCFIWFVNKGDNSWTSLKQPIDIVEPKKLIQRITQEIKRQKDKKKNPVDSKLLNLTTAISTLSFNVEKINDRLTVIERKLENNDIKNLTLISHSKKGKKYLISIGINNYSKIGQNLKYAVNDAVKIENIFKKSGYITRLLTNKQATKAKIQENIVDYLSKNTKIEDTVILYYSGHGFVKKDSNGKEMGFLCPSDSDISKIYASCISMTQIKDWFRLIPAKQIVFIIDSCVAGLAGKQVLTKDLIREQMPLQSLVPNNPIRFDKLDSKDRAIFSACKGDEQALEPISLQHGLFTYFLLDGLRGKADLDRDGKISLEELYFFVSPKVTSASRQLQTPQIYRWGKATFGLVDNISHTKSPFSLPDIEPLSK